MYTTQSLASALSDSVVVYQIQTAGAVSGTASRELILLLNTASEAVNVTDWCIEYSSASDSSGFKKCITTSEAGIQLWLEPGGVVSFASNEFLVENQSFVADVVFTAGMAASGGHLRLFDAQDTEVDRVGWGSAINPETSATIAHNSGEVISRTTDSVVIDTDNNSIDFQSRPVLQSVTSGLFEVEVPVDVCPNIEELQEDVPEGYLLDDDMDCILDVCPNLDELQATIPDDHDLKDGLCVERVYEERVILITEVYPNAPSYDTGNEFIELYNPHGDSIDITGYKIEVGPSFTKHYVIDSLVIPTQSFIALSDSLTGIVLPNASGVALRLRNAAGEIVSQVPQYSELSDDSSWSLYEDTWIVTNQPTRASTNKPYIEPALDEVLGVSTVLAPCPIGKYRNPQTNRCRTIETAVSTLAPCNEDEYRNPETNRCRKISTASSALAPCQEGYERNPETNRCRKIVPLEADTIAELPQVTDVAVEQTGGTFNWPITSASLLGTGGYIAYEWRSELRRKFRFIRFR